MVFRWGQRGNAAAPPPAPANNRAAKRGARRAAEAPTAPPPLERKALRRLTGLRAHELALYRQAFSAGSPHQNARQNVRASNERLEYLGDAVLGAIVAEYLYKKYPTRPEGFLTEMRSKLVNRQAMNALGQAMGLDRFLTVDGHSWGGQATSSVYGNALEALIGAIYLDRGYRATRRFVVRRMLGQLVNVEALEHTETNPKSRLMELAQKEKWGPVRFELVATKELRGGSREFTIGVVINGTAYGQGSGTKKKLAEQSAAEATLALLEAQTTSATPQEASPTPETADLDPAAASAPQNHRPDQPQDLTV